MLKPIVIALSGKKGAGKNTISPAIRDEFVKNWYRGVRNGLTLTKEYAFADLLKEFCIDVLGLEKHQCYGSDEEKNTPTKFRWLNADFRVEMGSGDFMTGRDVMQIFGTECVRNWFGNVWAEATLRRIDYEQPALAIVTDNRFPDEIEAILGHSRGYIIRLTRSPFSGDEHASETSLDGFDWNKDRCYVLDNSSLSIEEQKEAVLPIVRDIFHQELNNE